MLQIHTAMAYVWCPLKAKGMLIGPNILILPLLNPVHVAEEAATLDVLSGGNYVLGVGLGYREVEFEAFNIPLIRTGTRDWKRGIALMRRLWTGERITHKGRFYTVTDAGLSFLRSQRARRRADLDGGRRWTWAIRRVARIGDAWMIVPVTPLGKSGGADAPNLSAPRWRRPVTDCRTLSRSSSASASVGANHRTAQDECSGPLQYSYDAYASWGMGSQGETARSRMHARDRFIIGDAAFVKEEVARYREALGVDHFMMRCHWPGLEQEKVLGSIRADWGRFFG